MRLVRAVGGAALLAVVALTALALPLVLEQAGASEPYGYFDDFSTDTAMTDSHLHSPLVLVPPEITLDGVLMYGIGNTGRSLYFYSGFLVGADAFLYYRFPLDGSVSAIGSGVVALDVWGHTHPGGALRVSALFEGTGGGFTESIVMYGHYEYLLDPPEPCEAVLLYIEGGGMTIDNLSILLYGSTFVSENSWGTIKSLFR